MSKSQKILFTIIGTLLVVLLVSVVAVFITKSRSNTETSVGATAQSMEQLVTDDLVITIDEEAGGYDQGALIRATEDYCTSHGISGNITVVACDMLDSEVFRCTIKYGDTTVDFEFNLFDYKL